MYSIWLCWVLLHGLFFSWGKQGLLRSCSAQASHCSVFSLQSMGSRVSGLQYLCLVGSVVAAPRLQSTGSIVVLYCCLQA